MNFGRFGSTFFRQGAKGFFQSSIPKVPLKMRGYSTLSLKMQDM